EANSYCSSPGHVVGPLIPVQGTDPCGGGTNAASNRDGSAISGDTTTAALRRRHYDGGTTTAALRRRHYDGGTTTAALRRRHYDGGTTRAALAACDTVYSV
ncbi:hypothetical protein LSAT2_017454, partial [Lamellibrachia satsuma]